MMIRPRIPNKHRNRTASAVSGAVLCLRTIISVILISDINNLKTQQKAL